MSTLPEIFKPPTKQSILKRKPQKQGGIFSIKLKQSPVAEEFLPKKYSVSRIGTSNTTRTGRISIQSEYRPYSRQSGSEVRIGDWSGRGTWVIEEKKNPTEQVDNLQNKGNEILEEISKIQHDLDEVSKEENQLRQGLTQIKQRMVQEFDEIDQAMKGGFEEMRKQLSKMRRESGMGTKVNKGQTEQLEVGFGQIDNISAQFCSKLDYLAELCIR